MNIFFKTFHLIIKLSIVVTADFNALLIPTLLPGIPPHFPILHSSKLHVSARTRSTECAQISAGGKKVMVKRVYTVLQQDLKLLDTSSYMLTYGRQ